MQSNEMPRKRLSDSGLKGHQHQSGVYHKVMDGRKRPIRGLWVRNGHFYARFSVENADNGCKKVRRVRLEGCETVAQAQAELRRLITRREDNTLPVLKRAPKFAGYAQQYLAYYDVVKDAKRPGTLRTERSYLGQWIRHLGDTRLDKITRPMVNAFIAKRQGEGVSARTVNLNVVCLRNVLKRAIEDGWLKSLPTDHLKPLKCSPPKRELVTGEQIERVCHAALETSKNGQEFAEYVRLMAFCGARMAETLRLKWSDVDWRCKQLTIGADGLSKNHKSRVVDVNTKLEAQLKDMALRKAPDSEWLFPSPQRGKVDRHAETFRETLVKARTAAGMPGFGFHDCRHFFISYCVMSGIDYMTIARWVGHQDGGILIGKVYGHLSNEHAQRQAQRVNFGPFILEQGRAA